MPDTVLVAGASGVIGSAALQQFLDAQDWDVIALSRRAPDVPAGQRPYRHLSVDLRDGDAVRSALESVGEVTHLVYAALYEKPGLIAGWRERDQMTANEEMLRNLVEPLTAGRRSLRHVSLLQGTKAYGVHLHRVPVPARERAPRDPHENFYWLQEDYLRSKGRECGFASTIFRPQVVFGDVVGVAMNIIPVLGAYAAICTAEGRPFGFPGGPSYVLEAVDARLVARAMVWAATSPAAREETFNITNGDVFTWRDAWPAIAEALGVEAGPDDPMSLAEFLEARAQLWDRIVNEHGLRRLSMREVLGESHHYADFCFAHGARRTPPPVIVSTIKLRQAGFGDCIDTEDMFRELLSRLIAERIIPPGPRVRTAFTPSRSA